MHFCESLKNLLLVMVSNDAAGSLTPRFAAINRSIRGCVTASRPGNRTLQMTAIYSVVLLQDLWTQTFQILDSFRPDLKRQLADNLNPVVNALPVVTAAA